ncbi:hypothetical protein NL676_013030 [Syzygium grande]|nr:hypothetical protein NL676_013030 [Syzygium grande]
MRLRDEDRVVWVKSSAPRSHRHRPNSLSIHSQKETTEGTVGKERKDVWEGALDFLDVFRIGSSLSFRRCKKGDDM